MNEQEYLAFALRTLARGWSEGQYRTYNTPAIPVMVLFTAENATQKLRANYRGYRGYYAGDWYNTQNACALAEVYRKNDAGLWERQWPADFRFLGEPKDMATCPIQAAQK